MTFFACKKEDNAATAPSYATKVAVQFNVSNFASQIEPMDGKNVRKAAVSNSKDASLTTVSDLYYVIVGTTPGFHIVKSVHQTSDALDFGVIKDSLDQGSYYIAVTGTAQPFPSETPAGAFPEIFSTRVDFTVGSTPGAPLALTLQRRVGLLEVNVLDATPADEVKVFFSYEATSFDKTRTVAGGDRNTPMPVAAKSATKFSDFILNDLNTPTVTIEYKNRATGATERKFVVTKIKANNKTTVTGTLYSPDNRNEFKVMVNNAWGANPTDTNF
ncbi:hypothetical protein [Chitinophaga varians]|uniref:hypothetical protein n=1 Tax=Chitinophaga varians TaxID=2202339 RepID=UPI00165FC64F|nr:hypothetical protein [Chitinophaga varians]MBC9914396.1 hypothetical protein [Chitinophaga varians]